MATIMQELSNKVLKHILNIFCGGEKEVLSDLKFDTGRRLSPFGYKYREFEPC